MKSSNKNTQKDPKDAPLWLSYTVAIGLFILIFGVGYQRFLKKYSL